MENYLDPNSTLGAYTPEEQRAMADAVAAIRHNNKAEAEKAAALADVEKNSATWDNAAKSLWGNNYKIH